MHLPPLQTCKSPQKRRAGAVEPQARAGTEWSAFLMAPGMVMQTSSAKRASAAAGFWRFHHPASSQSGKGRRGRLLYSKEQPLHRRRGRGWGLGEALCLHDGHTLRQTQTRACDQDTMITPAFKFSKPFSCRRTWAWTQGTFPGASCGRRAKQQSSNRSPTRPSNPQASSRRRMSAAKRSRVRCAVHLCCQSVQPLAGLLLS